MPKDPAEVVLPLLQPLLADGEELRGWCLATEQSTFSGHTTVVGVTDQRLLVQAVDRKFRPKDDLLSIAPDRAREGERRRRRWRVVDRERGDPRRHRTHGEARDDER